ncbi:hypothetical protein FXB38_37130 [Bradyrhizobium cytisi]|uniref:Uncharacterized protein n=1 Tax=Bradyrhizobium cytisi TaxID=515489 RepID=A0A5S4WE63_9BRAD|nr:hypothetical protein FXB38_37130 [Bradyrhizobium cytisi]
MRWRCPSSPRGSFYKRPSCPGLSRASTFFVPRGQDVDGRDKPGHDESGMRDHRRTSLLSQRLNQQAAPRRLRCGISHSVSPWPAAIASAID